MPKQSVRCSVFISPALNQRLMQLVSGQPRSTSRADLIREAIRRYLDEQEDLTGSRRHFQRSFRQRIDQLEDALTFHMLILTYLLAQDEDILRDAVIAAKQHGETLRKQIQAVRDLEIDG